MRYLEDLVEGGQLDLGTVAVDRAESVTFATRFDPQPFHVDAAVAAGTAFGGLIASGWHTCAMWSRLYVDGLHDVANLGGLGVDDLRFTVPVWPGDILTGRAEVVEPRLLTRKHDRGTLVVRGTMHNRREQEVLSMLLSGRVAARPAKRSVT